MLLSLAVDQRGDDADALFAFADVPAELEPAAEAGDVGGLRLLRQDEQAVVPGVGMESAHRVQIAGERFTASGLQFRL